MNFFSGKKVLVAGAAGFVGSHLTQRLVNSGAIVRGTLHKSNPLLEIGGVDYESKAAYSAKEREGLSWSDWAKRLQKYYSTLEALLTPDLFIVAGGVSKEHEEFLPLLKLKTPIVPAENRNSAGIMGAAYWAKKHSTD